MLVVVLVVFVLCWMPYLLYEVILLNHKTIRYNPLRLGRVTHKSVYA